MKPSRVMSAAISHLSELLHHLAAQHSGNLAVATAHQEMTFSQLDTAATAWATALRAHGCRTGSCVGLLGPNSPDWLAVAFGAWRAQATLVPISTFVTPRELAETLDHAGVEVLVTAPRLRGNDYLAALRTIDTAKLRHTVTFGPDNADHLSATQFLNESSATLLVRVDPESIACILYTSGTTGRPKGVRLSHRAIMSTTLPTAERSGLSPEDSLLSTLPLFWVAGLVIRALPTLTAGCSLLFVDTYTPEAIIELLVTRQPTALHLRPPQVADLLRHPSFDPRLLSRVRRGNGRVEWFGGHLPQAARFITGYGMTEMAGYVTALDWRDGEEARREGMGSPLPAVEIRIVDADGRACRPGEIGAIRVRGPGMFSGYHKEAVGCGLDAGGWFDTGDLGALDADGTFRFAGRTKDLLRVKGINVSPIEVEQVLGRHAGVEAVYIVGLPPGALEQRVVALVVANGDANADIETELRAMAAAELSHYKRPEAYVFLSLDEIPFGPTSKPQKSLLTELAADRLGER